jgi:hypothetical protein
VLLFLLDADFEFALGCLHFFASAGSSSALVSFSWMKAIS